MDDESLKRKVRRELTRVAREGRRVTYEELGELVGRPRQGPWRHVLDKICKEEKTADRPDLTLVVVLKPTGFPSRFEGKPMAPEAR